ncbi:MAG: 5-formyltetrahydrofolate cyclo-ligase [Bacteroidota bacterium]
MTKAEARKLYLQKRTVLVGAHEMSLRIHKNILASGYLKSAKTVHIFMATMEEPDTWELIKDLRSRKKKIVIPRVNNSGTLDHFYYKNFEQLTEGAFGILEPTDGIPAKVEDIDLVFVPLVAFDKEGNRVGYGKGFYDRFLKNCRPDCVKAGLSFFPPADVFDDVEDHDIPLDVCFTPNNLYTFGS